MPSKPPSPSESTASAIAVLAVGTVGLFAKTFTAPVFSSTYQRESSPGAWSMSSGELNVRPGNARTTWIVEPAPLFFAGATHVVFDGRASRPPVGVGAGGGGVAGGVSSPEDE